jgi:DNA-directed RNA polymerase specialized sigma24 family protein
MQTLTDYRRDAAQECYAEVARLIQQDVNRHLERSGGDPHLALEAAHDGFLKAFDRYDPNRGAEFSTFCRLVVRQFLLRKFVARARRLQTVSGQDALLFAAAAPRRFDAERLLCELGDDAAEVVRELIADPGEPGEYGAKRLARLSRTFRDGGWSIDRVRAAFREVSEAIRS